MTMKKKMLCSCCRIYRLVAGAEEPFVKGTLNYKVEQVRAHGGSKNQVWALACVKNSRVNEMGTGAIFL